MGIRNLFQQYSKEENQLTHSLACCLNANREFLKAFIKDFLKLDIQNFEKAVIYEQSLPGEEIEDPEEDIKEKGLPDLIIELHILKNSIKEYIVFENKVTSRLNKSQLKRHFKTLNHKKIYTNNLFTITSELIAPGLSEWENKYWKDLYILLSNFKNCYLCSELKDFMQALTLSLREKGQLIRESLVTYEGIDFGAEGFNSRIARFYMELILDELRNANILKQLNINLEHKGRSKIKHDEDYTWNYLLINNDQEDLDYTERLHFKLSINRNDIFIGLVIPDKLKNKYRKNIIDNNEYYEEFKVAVKSLIINHHGYFKNIKGVKPWIICGQQRFIPYEQDALIEFDPRTCFNKEDFGHNIPNNKIKNFNFWLEPVFKAIPKSNKNGVNLQIAIGYIFDYKKCKDLKDISSLNLFINALQGCEDFLNWLENYR